MSGDLPEIEDGLDPAVPYTTDVTVSGLTCDEVGRAPVGDADNSVYNVTLRVQYSCDVTIEQNGTVYYQGTLADTFFRTLCLCAPAGSTIDCARYSTVEGQAFVAAFEEEPAQASVQVNAGICLVTQSFATVQLLVPSYGFCVPGACPDVQTGIPCPPEMFPSGCGNAGSGS